MTLPANRISAVFWFGCVICTTAAALLTVLAANAGERAAASIRLDTYLQRQPALPAAAGAVQLDSAAAAGASRVTGSWSGSTSAPTILQRGTSYQSSQIAPVGRGVTPGSKTHRVGWQYSFLTAPPSGVRAYLCNYARCVALSGASGSTAAFDGDNGFSYFSFAFIVDGRGAMTPALQGASSQVIVNYE